MTAGNPPSLGLSSLWQAGPAPTTMLPCETWASASWPPTTRRSPRRSRRGVAGASRAARTN